MERTIFSRKYFILNHIFVGSLILLFINDHFLKEKFASTLTGKLSDIAGIILLPLFIAFLWPRIKLYAVPFSALLFIFWKSTFSQPLIDFYNEYALLETSRVADPTDLLVLPFLAVPYFLIIRMDYLKRMRINNVHPLLIVAPTVCTLMATSPPEKHYYTRTEGNLACYGCNITVKYPQDEIVKKLADHNISFSSISSLDSATLKRFPHLQSENAQYYRIDQLVIDKDTLRNLDFTMKTSAKGRTTIYFNGMQVAEDIPSQKLEIKLRKYYKQLLFNELKQRINH